ncbi:hypothetical protein E2C01_049282 [Portunus trituberculatus]|uniref:Uncharacterized protein n=1 Tax=Portunus trituberculatus TaxID=210409 RepID=A0A5B7GCM5_PORTR|nr:hypothetical protein [Portunus trituberculatus]
MMTVWGLRCLARIAQAEKRKEIINTVLASGCGLQTSKWAVGSQWTGSDAAVSLHVTKITAYRTKRGEGQKFYAASDFGGDSDTTCCIRNFTKFLVFIRVLHNS